MFKNKKGFETYLIGIFIIAIIMAFLLVTIINQIYEPDPPECRDVDFFVQSICQKDRSILLTLANENDAFVRIMVNDEKNPDYNIQSRGVTTIVLFQQEPEKVVVMPYITKGDKDYTCKANRYTISPT
jgi:hypothetical protein